MVTIGFGGGCHWCTEAVFQSLKGVRCVRQGFIKSDPPMETFSEAVEVDYEPGEISLGSLIAVHLSTHASTSQHSMRGKYRSAIYTNGVIQKAEVEAALRDISDKAGEEYITQVLNHCGFKFSDARFQNYHRNGPDKPFCETYISPKLAKIRKNFAELV